jgi:hypothetical protein
MDGVVATAPLTEVRPGALALHGEDRELTLIALVTHAFSRHPFAGDAAWFGEEANIESERQLA